MGEAGFAAAAAETVELGGGVRDGELVRGGAEEGDKAGEEAAGPKEEREWGEERSRRGARGGARGEGGAAREAAAGLETGEAAALARPRMARRGEAGWRLRREGMGEA